MATPNDSPGTDQGEIQFEQAESPPAPTSTNPATAPTAALSSTTSPWSRAFRCSRLRPFCGFGEVGNSGGAGLSYMLASPERILEIGFVFQPETEAIGCYSLWDNGLSANAIGFVRRFFSARQARAAFFPADAG
jgi:hypothetical protein